MSLEEQLVSRGKDVWIDLTDIPPGGEWRAEIRSGIAAATAFIFVLSPDSIESPECLDELRYACDLNKRIVPVLLRSVDNESVPRPLAELQWVTFVDTEASTQQIDIVIDALETDLAWRQMHARLAVRAWEWEESKEDKSSLLRGGDLRRAEEWLDQETDHEERPTAQQMRYIRAGRRAATRRQKNTVVTVGAVMAVAVSLAVAAFVQSREAASERARAERESSVAREQADVALSRQLASDAIAMPADRYDTALLLAAQALDVSDTFEARSSLFRILDSIPQVAMFLDHSAGQEVARWTADGRVVRWPSGQLGLWDVERRVAGEPLPLEGDLPHVAVTDDSGLLAGADGEEVTLVSLAEQPVVVGTMNLSGDVTDLEFSRDGSLLAASTLRQVTLYDAATHRVLQTFSNPASGHGELLELSDLAFSADDRRLAVSASASLGGSGVYVYDLTRDSGAAVLEGIDNGVDLEFSPTDPVLLAVQTNFETTLVDVETGQRAGQPLVGRLNMYSVAFSHDGSLLASGGDEGFAVWSVASRQELVGSWALPMHVLEVMFVPGGQLVVSGADGTVLWEPAASSRLASSMDPGVGTLWAAALTSDGRRLAVAGESGLALWDIAGEPEPIWETGADTIPVADVAFSPDGALLATSEEAGIVLRDVGTGKSVGDPLAYESLYLQEAPYAFAFSEDGRVIAAGYERDVISWNVAQRQMVGEPLVYEAEGSAYVEAVAFNPAGSVLAAGGDSGVLRWRWPDGERSGVELRHPIDLADMAFHPQGRLLAVAGRSRTVLWDTARAQLADEPIEVGHDTVSAAFDPDGRLLALGGADGVTLWDVAAGRPYSSYRLTPESGTPLAAEVLFSANGRQLLHVGGTAEVTTFVVSPTSWADIACGVANRPLSQQEWTEFVGGARPYAPTCS